MIIQLSLSSYDHFHKANDKQIERLVEIVNENEDYDWHEKICSFVHKELPPAKVSSTSEVDLTLVDDFGCYDQEELNDLKADILLHGQ